MNAMENIIIFDRIICGEFAILLDTTAGHFDFNFDFNYPDTLRTSKNHQIFILCLQDVDLLQFFSLRISRGLGYYCFPVTVNVIRRDEIMLSQHIKKYSLFIRFKTTKLTQIM